MKLIGSNTRTLTVKLSRQEMQDLSTALSLALGVMLEQRAQGIVFSRDERYLPRVQNLQQRITRLVIEKGWLEDREED
jgi:hypothetical protein